MKEIILSNGLSALVDDSDYEWLNSVSWQHSNGYARRCYEVKGKKKIISMHTLIMKPIKPLEVDHINRNKLDNRRENLRVVTHSTNCHNREKGQRGVRVSYRTPGRWTAEIYINGKKHHLGTFTKPEQALEARIAAENEVGLGVHGGTKVALKVVGE